MIIETGSDGEGSISFTPSSASNEALRKTKKRKPTAPAPANKSIEASVRAASHALKNITGRRDLPGLPRLSDDFRSRPGKHHRCSYSQAAHDGNSGTSGKCFRSQELRQQIASQWIILVLQPVLPLLHGMTMPTGTKTSVIQISF